MGELVLPESGLVYIDAGILIYSVETHAAYWPILKPLWEAAEKKIITVASSELSILECLVAPIRKEDARLVVAYEAIFGSETFRLLPITQDVLRRAAQLRATSPSLRSPDAIHAATCMLAGSSLFLTNDKGLRGIPGLQATVLGEVI